MVRAILIENDVVVNMTTFENINDVFEGWVVDEVSEIGWVKQDGVFVCPNISTPDIPELLIYKIRNINELRDGICASPIEFPSESGVYYKVSESILNTITQATVILNLSDTDAIPVDNNNNCWDNFNKTISTPFTVAMLKELYKTGYMRSENNYSNAKKLISDVTTLATTEGVTIEDIINYDITTGWM